MSNYLITRNPVPSDNELVPPGSSPGWMKSSFSEGYTDYTDTDTDREEDYLKSSAGDASLFVSDYAHFDMEDEYLDEMLPKLFSTNKETRYTASEEILKMLKSGTINAIMYDNIMDSLKRTPYEDVRIMFSEYKDEFVDICNETISTNEFMTLDNCDREFLSKIKEWHSSYYDIYIQTYDHIMRSDGPLPHHLRNYFAILSASRFKCHYLVNLQEREFIMNGGNPSWIEDISNASHKMKVIFELNQLLAHQPWLVTPKHIENILKDHLWTISELVHGCVIMATFRLLSSIYFGISILPDDIALCFNGGDDIIEELCNSSMSHSNEKESKEQKKKRFEEAEVNSPLNNQDESSSWEEFSKYIGEYRMVHENFDVKSKEYDIFKFNEFSWDEMGFEILNRYYNDLSGLLDEKFKSIRKLTYHQLRGKAGIDTAPFRRALWNYAHRVQGIEHDDYCYSLVNQLVQIPMKSFVKNLVCKPYTIKEEDINNFSFNLYTDEICHIVLLVSEARLQGELIYVLRAISQYLAS